jgi:GTP diphosphokinase / guanosine-3',5'-bis(diphosphate) 3'-diphosphatase
MNFSDYLTMQQKAREYLQEASKGMMRYCSAIENQPYWTHPMNVHNFLVTKGVDDFEVLIAAILHDAIEDLGATKDFISSNFNNRIAEIVHIVSKPANYDPQVYYQGILNFQDDYAMKIKVADRIDNLLTFYSYSEDALHSDKYIDETATYFLPMAQQVGWEEPLNEVFQYFKSKNSLVRSQ